MSFDFSEFEKFAENFEEDTIKQLGKGLEDDLTCPQCNSKLENCKLDLVDKKGTCYCKTCNTNININIE